MQIVTLAMFVRENQILLAMKKRGFGAGFWNGYGGKLLPGESVVDAAVREIKEESGITVLPENLEHLGTLDFYFTDKPEWNQRGMIYRVAAGEAEAVETEEMRPQWFDFDKMPYADMWAGDDEWFPYFLKVEKFSGEIRFNEQGKKVVSIEIKKDNEKMASA